MKKMISLVMVTWWVTCLSAQTEGTLTVSATTSRTSTEAYAPSNILAMWIEDSNGKFVKTLLALAEERKQHLLNWKAITTIARSSYNTVDAITGETQHTHGTRACKWNGKNIASVTVADGNYKIRMELTDNEDGNQNLATFTFKKGSARQLLTPATTNGFSNINIEWVPLNTGLNELTESVDYGIYPNATGTSFRVTGNDIDKIEICSLEGKRVYRSSETNIYLNFLPKGVYMVNIFTRNRRVTRKFIKE